MTMTDFFSILFKSYNETYEAIKGIDDRIGSEDDPGHPNTILRRVIDFKHVFNMAFVDTFRKNTSNRNGSPYNAGADLRACMEDPNYKIEYIKTFFGIVSTDYQTSRWFLKRVLFKMAGTLSTIGRAVGNILKSVTVFPVVLIDYAIEKILAHTADLNQYFLENARDSDRDTSNSSRVLNGFAAFGLFFIMTLPFMVAHACLKMASTTIRLLGSPFKVWKEADAIDKVLSFPLFGILARIATFALATGVCVVVPVLSIHFFPIAGAALAEIGHGVLVLGAHIVGSSAGMATAASVGTLIISVSAGVAATLGMICSKPCRHLADKCRHFLMKMYERYVESNFSSVRESESSREGRLSRDICLGGTDADLLRKHFKKPFAENSDSNKTGLSSLIRRDSDEPSEEANTKSGYSQFFSECAKSLGWHRVFQWKTVPDRSSERNSPNSIHERVSSIDSQDSQRSQTFGG